jgi:hypothetical protein
MEPRILQTDGTDTLYQITTVNGLTISILVCKDGEEYSTTDWQGPQPTSLSEVEDYDWELLINMARL